MVLTHIAWAVIVTSVHMVSYDLQIKTWHSWPMFSYHLQEIALYSRFAEALGRRPSEITKWLSGQHNFTIATLAMLSSFFGQPIITVS